MRVGVVAIGRNEGARLVRCLRSVGAIGLPVVYVDSGSSDGSAEVAHRAGASVVELDASRPFSAARARNAGITRLRHEHPDLDAFQVVDGDCELVATWLPTATASLAADASLAVICGRRTERFPGASVWNQLADVEWDAAPGDVDSCGGDALIRVSAWEIAGGYDEGLIAGEDPEFCFRVRQKGWRIRRLDEPMTVHDAALLRFGQWWQRQRRAGHAYAETVWIHRRRPDRNRLRRLVSILFWGACVPGASAALALPTHGLSLLVLAGWIRPALSAYRDARNRWPARVARRWAIACAVGKVPEAYGALGFFLNRVRDRRATLIEYKGAGGSGRD